ncbi:hypothetical protein D3C86_1730410 [compost metagenome]
MPPAPAATRTIRPITPPTATRRPSRAFSELAYECFSASIARSTRRATQPPLCAGFRILDASMGDRLSARKAEKATAAAMAAASSTNRRPT